MAAITPQDLKNLQDAIEKLTNSIASGNLFGNNSNGNNPFLRLNHNNSFDDYLYKKIEKGKYKDNRFAKQIAKESKRERAEALERRRNGVSKNDITRYALNKINNIATGVFKIIESGVDIWVAFQEKHIAYSKATLEKNVQITQTNLRKQTQVISTGMKTITSGFTKNVVDVSKDLVQASYDIAKTAGTSYMEFELAAKKYNVAITQADANFTSSMIKGGGAIAGAITGAIIGSVVPGVGNVVGAIIGGAVGLIASSWDKIWGINIKKQELAIAQQEQAKSLFENFSDSFKQITEPWDNLYDESTKFVLKIKDAAQQFSRTVGYGGTDFASTMLRISQSTLVNGKTMAQIFGKETEKLPQIMDSYLQTSSRAVNMSAQDYGNIMGTGRLFGMSSEEASGLYGSMNIFNTSISSASDSMGVIYHQITKMGLSSKKFGKDLVENLKLAQKYNFKGGVDNMMKLTKWAQQTRFNLNSAASFADSIMNDSLSGALEKAAKLQVLGGSAAIYSDPLGMLYDAGADVGNMAERMASMFNDITGTFNRKTGETEFNWYENRMLAARAQAMGMDVGEARNMIRQNQKQGVINRELRGSGLSKEDKLAIGNRATYNQNKRRWEVTDIRGNTHDIQDYTNGKANIEDLLPADTQESILTVSQRQLSVQEKIEAAVTQRMGKLGVAKEGEIEKATLDKQKIMDDLYNNNWEATLQMWDKAYQYSIDVVEKSASIMEKSLNEQDTVQNIYNGNLKRMQETIDSIDNELKIAASVFTNDIEVINAWLLKKVGAELTKEQKELLEKNSLLYSKQQHIDGKWVDINDGVGNTNGGMIFGASNVKAINDGGVNVKTVSQDQYLAAMPNGPIDKILQQLIPGLQALLLNDNRNSNSNSANININGKLELSQDGSTLNLVELIKNNPAIGPQFIYALMKALGKPVYNTKFLG